MLPATTGDPTSGRPTTGDPTTRRVERLDAFQRRHRALGFPVATTYKFFDDQGPYLAALIAYYGFLSFFPLLLLLASTLGFLLQHDPDLQRRILESTLAQFPVIGDELGEPRGLRGSTSALVTGGLVALYGALGVAQAVQHALNTAWAVPRNRRPNPLHARLRSLLLIGVASVATLATTVLAALVGAGSAFGSRLGGWDTVVALIGTLVLNATVFVTAFWICTPSPRRPAHVVPGALVAAVVWQVLQLSGTAYVGHVVKDNGPTYGVFALVLGLLGWIFLAGVGIVVGAEVNVVHGRRLYPRALMTPFTDDVDLTRADRRAYAGAAEAQRFKGPEHVDVTFEHDGQFATARRGVRTDMANRITALAVDCTDGHRLADFWTAVLGWVVTDTDDHGNVSIKPSPDAGWGIDFLVVPDGPKTSKNRLHLDVNATDRDQAAELERLLALGARPVDIGQGDVSWHVLADPEGNEFCLLRRTVAPVD